MTNRHAPLDKAQIGSFHSTGFVIVPGLFSPEEMVEIRAWTDAVHQWPETAGQHMMYFEHAAESGERILNRIENLLPFHEQFRTLANNSRMKGSCAQLFGEPAVLFKDKINFKMPGGGGFEPHQDAQAGWGRYADLHITALISIDRGTIENGCLQIAAGQHKVGLLGKEWEPLDDARLTDVEYVPIETEPGDAIFFDSYTPHRSEPNHSSAARRVLYFTYNRMSAGDHLQQYYADKRASYPPDVERDPDKEYQYRV